MKCAKCGVNNASFDYGRKAIGSEPEIKRQPICIPCLELHYPEAYEVLPGAIDSWQSFKGAH